MARSIWKGALVFGLVNIPIAVYSMVKSERPRLNMLCTKDKSQIRFKKWCTEEDKEIPYSDVIYGLKVGANYITVTKEEIESITRKKENALEISTFVNASDIPLIYYDKPYLLLPEAKNSTKAFGLFADSMAKAGKIAIGKVIIRDRERLVAVYPYADTLILHMLRFGDEIEKVTIPPIESKATKRKRIWLFRSFPTWKAGSKLTNSRMSLQQDSPS